MKKALFYGLLGSLFFAFTFLFNRSMNLGGGYWLWSASLRYLFTLPVLWVIVQKQTGVQAVFREIRKQPVQWFLWSTVGFGLFYMPLSMASVYGESWFTAATWQITIVAGVLLTPLFGKKIPFKNLLCSAVILVGIFLLQLSHADHIHTDGMLAALALIIVAGFSYPLGNRKMLQYAPAEMTTIQRVFGMTLCSMPFWFLCSVYALASHGMPGAGQIFQSLIVAVFSGVIATILFFEATNMVKHNPRQLAVIEATQSGEVLFTLLGGICFLGDAMPTASGFIGIGIIIAGMILNSFLV
ncbi:MAG: multidrug resistance efflux transporter family protein [Lachnospiraceae bacterium]|nr:multidrug resistance efflux transporter family protein [Lachnospiraceae bacterium]MDY4969175.1 multidrug resistance efflux transporter family protein [Lachnospiraceae bacterium]